MIANSRDLPNFLVILLIFVAFQDHLFHICHGIECETGEKSYQVNSNWINEEGCSCTCLSEEVLGIGMIFCETENCKEPHESLTSSTYGRLGFLPLNPEMNYENLEKIDFIKMTGFAGDLTPSSNDCHYKRTGVRYRHGENWPSTDEHCTTCQCIYGVVYCKQNFVKCPSNSMPECEVGEPIIDQCCRNICSQGDDGLVSLPKLYNKTYASEEGNTSELDCWSNEEKRYFRHGSALSLEGSCVDQQCVCDSGNWTCRNTCLSLGSQQNLNNDLIQSNQHQDAEQCPQSSMYLWDPFCCPRCVGTEKCRIETKPSKTIEAGSRVILSNRECTCLQGTLKCSRSIRETWTGPLCYDAFLGRQQVGSIWTYEKDACLTCECHGMNTTVGDDARIICHSKECTDLICPENLVPLIKIEECCPSECVPPNYDGQPENIRDNTPVKQYTSSLAEMTLARGNGCRPLNFPDTTTTRDSIYEKTGHKPTTIPQLLLPVNSMQIINSSCKSLLCKCTLKLSWICSDYCPHCGDFKETDEFMSSPQRDDQGCCIACKGPVHWLMRPVNGDGKVFLLSDREKKISYQNFTFCLSDLNNWKILTFFAFCLVGFLIGFLIFLLYKKFGLSQRFRSKDASFRDTIANFFLDKEATVTKREILFKADTLHATFCPRIFKKKNKKRQYDLCEIEDNLHQQNYISQKSVSLPCIISNSGPNTLMLLSQNHKAQSEYNNKSTISMFNDHEGS